MQRERERLEREEREQKERDEKERQEQEQGKRERNTARGGSRGITRRDVAVRGTRATSTTRPGKLFFCLPLSQLTCTWTAAIRPGSVSGLPTRKPIGSTVGRGSPPGRRIRKT